MMATVTHVTSGSGLRKFQADGFLLDRVYQHITNRRTCYHLPNTECLSAVESERVREKTTIERFKWPILKTIERLCFDCSYYLS